MLNCLFCNIINGSLHSKKIYEDEFSVSFYDINPKYKIHALLLPKKHIPSLLDLKFDDYKLMGKLTTSIPIIAKKIGLCDGFKVNINVGEIGGQEIFHLHYHIVSIM